VTGVEGAVWNESVGDSGGESKGSSAGKGEMLGGGTKISETSGGVRCIWEGGADEYG